MTPSAVSLEQDTAPLSNVTISSQRCEPGSINIPIAKWPEGPSLSDGPIFVSRRMWPKITMPLTDSLRGIESSRDASAQNLSDSETPQDKNT